MTRFCDQGIAVLSKEDLLKLKALASERDRYRAESINQQDWLVEWNKSKAHVAELEALLNRCRFTCKIPFSLLDDINSAIDPIT